MRQLTSLEWHRLRLDPAVNISLGRMYSYGYTITLGAGESDVLAVTPGSDPVCVFALQLSTAGSRGAVLDFYEGGEVSPGVNLSGYPINKDIFEPDPFVTFADGSTIILPGTRIGEYRLDGSFRARGGVDVHAVVMAPGVDYHFVTTNLDNQSTDITLNIEAGRIDRRPPGL